MSEIKVDTVAEKTSANGVTVDGLNIKDSKLVTANSVVTSNITADAIDGTKIADNAIDSEHYTDASIDAAHLNADVITGATALTAEPADTDEFLISDAGTLKRIDYSLIKGGGTNTPAFMANLGSGQSISNGTSTKVNMDTEIFDTDGTFVYTGFRPAFVMTKSVDSTSAWEIFDNKREGYNVDNDALVANATTVEATANQIDLLSNGFKLRIATDPNVAETYVYAAFAEAPFVNSNGVPCNAR